MSLAELIDPLERPIPIPRSASHQNLFALIRAKAEPPVGVFDEAERGRVIEHGLSGAAEFVDAPDLGSPMSPILDAEAERRATAAVIDHIEVDLVDEQFANERGIGAD